MRYLKIAVTSAMLVALAACGQEDQHDAAATANVAAQPDPAAASAPATQPTAPMSVVESAARVADIKNKTSDCNLESANGLGFDPDVPSVSRSAPVVLSGWLIDSKIGSVPSTARIRIEAIDGSKAWEQSIAEWGDRGDVVSARGNNEAFQKSGFSVSLSIGALPANTYNVYLNYDSPDGDVSCAVGRQLVLVN